MVRWLRAHLLGENSTVGDVNRASTLREPCEQGVAGIPHGFPLTRAGSIAAAIEQ
jgi:hypothetical protein